MSNKATTTESIRRAPTTDWTDNDALRLEVLRLRDELLGAEAQLGELRARLLVFTERERFGPAVQHVRDFEHLLAVNEDLRGQLADMRSSTTWRLGRMIVRPVSALRRKSTPTTSAT